MDVKNSHASAILAQTTDPALSERLESHLAQLNEQIAHFSQLTLQSADQDKEDGDWETRIADQRQSA